MAGEIRRNPVRLATVALAVAGLLSTLTLRVPADEKPPPPPTPPAALGKTDTQITVRKPPIHTAPIQVDVNMVIVNVTVTDPFDRIVTGLDQNNFQVYDEKVEQKIAAFSTEDAPISVGLIFDSSGSMSAIPPTCGRR